ncbi:cytochrome b [Croceicoccus naphthovorans]|uniref:cytochrome b n=1 Tax=Croceicoccus naphthovorans TaxID=1348774 RepID=UPI000B2909E2|nr:cytochrome b [Croceicoccus naphthovorans]MBB3990504.1 cytochrome b561 [Croceicoccus naphthovorans]
MAIILHWLIAIAIIVNWRLAGAAEHLEGPAAAAYMNPHKALGITVLVLTVLRIVWRLVNPPPALRTDMATWERMLAKTVHALFYILLIAIPLLGWIASSSFGYGVDMFGLFQVPALPVANDPDAGKWVIGIHKALWTPMLILVALHILGALKHHFIDKDGELGRMIPGLGKR